MVMPVLQFQMAGFVRGCVARWSGIVEMARFVFGIFWSMEAKPHGEDAWSLARVSSPIKEAVEADGDAMSTMRGVHALAYLQEVVNQEVAAKRLMIVCRERYALALLIVPA
ncbi:MAG: hypothetical protein N2515_07310 [Deltaproteobacteria bacterium]|nr:hypothetical protein [Deltaproteobacteria bacterium]